MARHDVVIAGGGPAGLGAAIAMRLAGLSVAVYEANEPPVDKACGEGLLPGTLRLVKQLGVRLPENQGYPFRGIRFLHQDAFSAAEFRNGAALGLQRTALHRAMEMRAAELGVELHWRSPWQNDFGREANLVVAADGQHSPLRRGKGFAEICSSQRFGFRQHFRTRPWSDYVEVYFGEKHQIYITPISPESISVALLTSNPHQRLQNALQHFPALRERLQSVATSSSEKGALTAMRRVTHVVRDGMALVGDASGSVDAITGEGIGVALLQAFALADALRDGDLQRYAKRHCVIMRRPRAVATFLLFMADHSLLRGGLIRLLARAPRLFEELLAVHDQGLRQIFLPQSC